MCPRRDFLSLNAVALRDAKQDFTSIPFDGKTPDKLAFDNTLRELPDGSRVMVMHGGGDREPLHRNQVFLTRTQDKGKARSEMQPLDFGFPREGDTAADLLANLSERELADMFSRYGEERYSRQIARAICRRRMSQSYERSADLVDTIRHAIPTPAQFGSGHPAKRVFQALRIAVNDELAMVEDGLDAAMQILKPGGRIAVISFHSLEDRIVKERFRDASAPCTCPPDLPICGCNREATLRVLTPRVIRPGSSELDRNPRAASSRLRVAERTPAALPKDAA